MEKNMEQEKAIHTLNGHVMLISCPGSGKTTTLLRRIGNMIDQGIKPERILMVTFTKAAAEEMQQRFHQEYGRDNKVNFSTIHALCLRILIHYGGYTTENILNDYDARFFITELARRDNYINDPVKATGAFLTQYSAARNSRKNVSEVIPEDIPRKSFLYMARMYENMKEEKRLIDFDDMLIKTLEILQKADVLESLQNMWDYIQVDEYQDTNQLQKEILYRLAKKHGNLCVAGDDDQSIYRFRGAEPGIMLGFPKDFPDAVILKISTNYRSNFGIVRAAGKLINNNKNRFEKQFLANNEKPAKISVMGMESGLAQAKQVVQTVRECGCCYKDIAVLYRNNQQAEEIADIFYKNEIPFVSNERIPDSYENWIWMDMMAYYRLSQGQWKKTDLERAVSRPNRYLAPILRAAQGVEQKYMERAAERLCTGWKLDKAQTEIRRFYYDIRVLRNKKPKDFLAYILDVVGYRKYLQNYALQTNQDPSVYQQTIGIYERDASEFQNMEQWISYIHKRALGMKKRDKSGVTLSTMHRSKGLEWRQVIIIDCNEGITPSGKNTEKSAIEEERRLFYVAVTRAKESLYLFYIRPGRNGKKPKSRFLNELHQMEACGSDRIRQEDDIKVNDMVCHNTYGFCMVMEIDQDKCTVLCMSDHQIRILKKGSLTK